MDLPFVRLPTVARLLWDSGQGAAVLRCLLFLTMEPAGRVFHPLPVFLATEPARSLEMRACMKDMTSGPKVS